MKTIAINGLQIHNWLGGLHYGVEIPIQGLGFPEIRETEYPKPGAHGSVVTSVLYGSRQIIMKGWVFADTAIQYEVARRAFEANFVLQKDMYGNTNPLSLTFTTLDDLALQVSTYLVKFTFDTHMSTAGTWDLELTAPNYMLFSQTPQQVTLTRAAAGGAIFPAQVPTVLAGSVGGQASVVNIGTVETYPVIYLNGPLTNPIINNQTLGGYMQLNMTLGSTDQVVLDMINNSAILNGNQSVNQNIVSGSNWWWLLAGANTVSFLSDSVGDVGNAQLIYYPAYIGS